MSSTRRINEGVVSQVDATSDGASDDLGFPTDRDPAIRAGTIEAMTRADVILISAGRGTREERQAERCRRWEEDIDSEVERREERRGGNDAYERMVPERAERDEVEDERGGEEDSIAAAGGEAISFDPALNKFLSTAPQKPEVLGKNAWPSTVAPLSKMTAAQILWTKLVVGNEVRHAKTSSNRKGIVKKT